MIKVGFKLFGCFSVIFFLLFAGTYKAIKTTPPIRSISPEIAFGVYPVAREYLKDDFKNFLQKTMIASDVGKMEFSELELNAYLYWFLTEQIAPGGLQVFTDPYLEVNPGVLKLRVDIPLKAMFKVIGDKFAGREIRNSIDSMNENDGGGGRIALTLVVRVFWVEKDQKPYIYIDRLYIGVLPIIFPVVLYDLQDQMNKTIEDGFFKLYDYSPVYIRKIIVADKLITIKTELKITEETASRKKVEDFYQKNPDLASALNSKNCLYGCTEDERAELKKWMDNMKSKRADELSVEEMGYFKTASELMNTRRDMYRGEDIHRNGIDWRKVKQTDPNRDWQFRNYPGAGEGD